MGSKSVMTESMSESSRKMSFLTKTKKIQKKKEVEEPKSKFVTIPKRIHTISLQERLLKASDNRSRTEKHSSSSSPKGRVGPDAPTNSPIRRVGPSTPRVGPSTPSNSPKGRVGPSTPSNSPNGRVGPNKQSNSPVRRVGSISLSSSHPRSSPPPFVIISNLLLFHLDRRHRWKFTILKFTI